MTASPDVTTAPLADVPVGAVPVAGTATALPMPGLRASRRTKPPRHLADIDPAARADVAKELGVPAYRIKQVAHHYFARHTVDAAAMTDLPVAGREELVAALLPTLLTPVKVLQSGDGDTVKTVWRLHDGVMVESVLMRYPGRVTLCVSSQAGCGMACPFCATGQNGLTRNLSAAEILDQVGAASRWLDEQAAAGLGEPARVTNVVFMGMGEALANYRAAVTAVRRMVDPAPDGFGMSARGVTVSTVGLVPAIDRLADEGMPVTFALSLHAPDDELRDELVPLNSRYDVASVLDAARRYFDATGRRVSIEYALIRDMNDQAWRADLLGKELNARGKGWVHVNPIPLNPTPGSKWTASDPDVEDEFVRRLIARGIPTTVRDTRGSDIDGACGQLAATV